MNIPLDDHANERYKKIAEGKEPSAQTTDIMWITPRRLGWVFGLGLMASLIAEQFL